MASLSAVSPLSRVVPYVRCLARLYLDPPPVVLQLDLTGAVAHVQEREVHEAEKQRLQVAPRISRHSHLLTSFVSLAQFNWHRPN